MASFTKPTSFTTPVTPISPVAPIMPTAPKSFSVNGAMYPVESLPSLDTLNTLPNLNTMSSLGNLSSWKPRTNQQVSPFSDYNDPTQINSLADVIWDTLYRNDNLKRRDFGILSDIGEWGIPLISDLSRTVTGVADLVLNTTIEPIKQGNYKALGINTLINFGETMDILASPIKGLVYDGVEGLVKGSVGRVNYDVDTGVWLLDMVGEFVLDPFNWISFGTAGLAKGLVGSVGKEALETSVDVATKTGVKILATGVDPSDALKKTFKNFVNANYISNGNDINKAVIGALNQLGGDKGFTKEFIGIVQRQQLNGLAEAQIRNLSIAKGLAHIAKGSDFVEEVLAQGSLALNLIPVKTLKNLITKNPIWTTMSEHVSKIIYDSYIKVTGLEDVFNPINYKIAKQATPIIQDHITRILERTGLETIDAIDLDKMVTVRALNNIEKLNKLLDSEKTASEKLFIPEVLSEVSGNTVLSDMVKEVITDNPKLGFDEVLKIVGTDRTTVLQDINDIFAHNLNVIDTLNKNNNGVFQSLKTEYVAMTYKLSSTLQKYTDLDLFNETINKTISEMIENKNLLSPEELQKQIDLTKDLIKKKKYLEASMQNKTTRPKTTSDVDTFKKLKNDCKVVINNDKFLSENTFAFKNINTNKYFKKPKDVEYDVFLKDTFKKIYNDVNLKAVVDLVNNPTIKKIPVLEYSFERISPAIATLINFQELLQKNINPFELPSNKDRFVNAVLDLQRELHAIKGLNPKAITKEVDEFITAINSVNTYGFSESLLSSKSFSVLYQQKNEELFVLTKAFEATPVFDDAGNIVSEINLAQSLDEFNNNRTATAFLDSFINIDNSDISAVANNTKAVIRNLTNMNNFINSVYNNPYVSTELKNFYLSALMKKRNIYGATILLNSESLHKGVMKDFETFINSSQTVRKLNLNSLLSDTDSLLKSNNTKITKNFDALTDSDKAFYNNVVTTGETHTALDDAYLAEVIIKLRCPEQYIDNYVDGIPVNKAGKYIYVSDIEATGLSANNSYVTEIGLKQMGTENTISYRLAYSENTHNVSEEILKSRYPGLSIQDALEEYKKFYDPNNPLNKGVVFFDNEADMLQAYKEYLNTLDVGSDVIFHNGKAYDTPMLMDRGTTYGIDFINSPVYIAKDSLYDMRKLNLGYSVSQIEEMSLWNHLRQYINTLEIEDVSLAFLNPLSAHNIDTITNMCNIVTKSKECAFTRPLLNSLNKIKNNIQELSQNILKESKTKTVFAKELLNTPQAQQVFIKQCQAKYLENKKILENIDKYYTNPIQAATEKASLERQQKGIAETLRLANIDSNGVIQGTVNMNLVRMFYGYNMDNIPTQGYEKIVDLNLIKSYIDIPTNLLIPITNNYGRVGFSWENFYDLVRDLPSAYKAMTNGATVIENRELIKNNLIKLKELLADESAIYKFIKEDNIDARANYLMAEKLYYRAKERELDVSILDEDFIKIIRESQELKNTYIADEVIRKQIASVENGIDSPELQVQAWIDLLDQDLNNVTEYSENILRKLSTDKTLSKFTNTRTQVLLTLAAPVQKSFNSLKDYMSKLSPTEKLKVVNVIKRGNEINQFRAVKQLVEQTPEDLLATLYTGAMTIVYDKSFIDSFDAGETTKALLSRTQELKDKGIKLITDDTTNLIFIVPSKDNVFKSTIDPVTNESLYELNGQAIAIPKYSEIAQPESMRGQLPDNIIDDLNKGQESMIRITDGDATGSLYEVTNSEWYRTFYDRLPKAVQNELGDINTFVNPALFNGRSRFNLSVFGSYEVRNRFTDFSTNSLMKNFSNTFRTVGKNATGKCHYVDFVLNSGTSVNNGVIGDLLKAQKYDDVLKTFENSPETVLGALVYNKSGTPKLIQIKPTSKADLIRAQKLDAKILDYHVFSTAYGVINSQKLSDMNPVLREYTKLLRTFKLGYLTSTGYVMRNVIDTFGKNLIESRGNIIATAKYTYSAMKMYSEYDKIILDIINTSPNKILSKANIKKYFDIMNPKMSYDEWSYIHDILNEGAFVGEIKSLELYHDFRRTVKNQALSDEELQGLFETYRHAKRSLNPVDGLMGINSTIEDVQRLASYLMMRDNGMNFSEAVAKTAYNHFDYSLKTSFQKTMELVMPFYTFRMRNINYWLNVISENGWLAGALRDVMTPIWDFDDIDYYELQNNQSLQSRILSGNVQILDSGVTLRLNPSVSDALKFVTDPFGEAYNSLFSPIQMLVEAGLTLTPDTAIKQGVKNVFNIYDSKNSGAFDVVYNLLNFVPFGANAQRFMTGYKYAQETGSPLPAIMPSVFGRVKRFEPYTPYTKNYKQYKSYSKSYSKGSRKKKLYPRKTYPRRIYKKYSKPYDKSYPINFTNIYIDGMYSVPNVSTYTAKGNRYYHFSRLSHLPTVSIYDKLYNSRGKPRWDAMLQTVTPRNLKYVIKNTIHYK